MNLLLRPWMLVLLVVSGLGVFVVVQIIRLSNPPSDQTMVERFQRDRADFETLRGMLLEDAGIAAVRVDGVQRVGQRGVVKPETAGMSADRYKAYRTIFKRLKLQSMDRDETEVRFPIDGWGFGGDGWRLALIYRETTPSPLVASLDERQAVGPSGRKIFRKLETNWYALVNDL